MKRWQPLVELADLHTRTPTGPLAALLVGDAWRGPGRAYSLLNTDGVPLQLRATWSPERLELAMIGDPHTAILDPGRRADASVTSALALLDAASAPELRPLLWATVRHVLPAGRDRAMLHDGALWLGAGVDSVPHVAIHATLAWADRDARWPRARTWLDAILPPGHGAWRSLARLVDHASPTTAVIEGRHLRDARARLCMRLVQPLPLAALGVAELAHPSILAFLDATTGDRAVPTTSLVLSIGVQVATGELSDVTVCVPRPGADWDGLWQHLTSTAPARARPRVEVACVGMARRSDGGTRRSLTLKSAARDVSGDALTLREAST